MLVIVRLLPVSPETLSMVRLACLPAILGNKSSRASIPGGVPLRVMRLTP